MWNHQIKNKKQLKVIIILFDPNRLSTLTLKMAMLYYIM